MPQYVTFNRPHKIKLLDFIMHIKIKSYKSSNTS